MPKKVISIVIIFENVYHILQTKAVGVERGTRIAHSRQMDITARWSHGRIELHTIVCTLHEIGGSQQLSMARQCHHCKCGNYNQFPSMESLHYEEWSVRF